MHDASELLKIIKRAAIEAVAATNPVAVCFGEVIGISPLKIKLDQKITLSKGQLVLCKEIGSIEEDDSVILIRQQGGQKYIVLGVI